MTRRKDLALSGHTQRLDAFHSLVFPGTVARRSLVQKEDGHLGYMISQ